MVDGFRKKYFGTQMAREDAYRRGDRTNPKQPVKNPTFVDRHDVDARYLPWELSKSTSAYGLDARMINENLRDAFSRRDWNASSTIEGIVDSLSRGAARTKGAYEDISATGLPSYFDLSHTGTSSYGLVSTNGPSGDPGTPTTLGTGDMTGGYQKPPVARYGSATFGPN